ncbi:MAG: VOC family protein [Aestuariivirga sp.]
MPSITLNRVLIYAKDVSKMADFYVRHFSFAAVADDDGRIIELVPKDGGSRLMLHRASRGRKAGQSIIKLVFDVADVERFKQRALESGLKFGATHIADGYSFSNARDPEGNPIQVSSRGFRQ